VRIARNGASKKRGIGFATFMHGAGFTGSGEVYLQSVVSAEAPPKAKCEYSPPAPRSAGHEHDLFADRRGSSRLDFESIEIVQPDTGACRTVDQPSRRARRWWSASWSSRR
jgi:hypothetical protein